VFVLVLQCNAIAHTVLHVSQNETKIRYDTKIRTCHVSSVSLQSELSVSNHPCYVDVVYSSYHQYSLNNVFIIHEHEHNPALNQNNKFKCRLECETENKYQKFIT